VSLTADLWSRAANASLAEICAAAGVSVVMLAASVFVTGWYLLRLPDDYFVSTKRPLPLAGHPAPVRVAARIGRNLAGLALVILGVVLSLPGVPGQGILTILLGIILLDFPGKRRVERGIVRRGFVHRAINRLRSRFGRPPILVPG